MDSFDDNVVSSFSFGNLIPPELYENSYILYSLIALILVGVSYLAYKYYLNKNSSIGSTNIDYLQTTNEINNESNNESNDESNEQYNE